VRDFPFARGAMSEHKLWSKASDLPRTPGVYIIKNKAGTIIYIGKSVSLRNRVTTYFAASARHDDKTAKMVEAADDFDFIATDTEIEALILENKLIKIHQPKYNIRLKDAKSYPYIKIDYESPFPTISITRRRLSDRAKYFGPYFNQGNVHEILSAVRRIFRVHSCKHSFPRDIGRFRPCLYKQIGHCVAPCGGEVSREEYAAIFREIESFLRGNFVAVRTLLEGQMQKSAEELKFEAAVMYRDRLATLSRLWDKHRVQFVAENIGGGVANMYREGQAGLADDVEYDVIALHRDTVYSCLAVGTIRAGALLDNQYVIIGPEQILTSDTIVSLICEIYSQREYVPKDILVGFELPESSALVLEEYIRQSSEEQKRVKLHFPIRGERRSLCNLIEKNAMLHASQHAIQVERESKALIQLAQLLSLEVVPQNIEAVDISNLGTEHITAGLVSFVDAKPNKKGYRTYKIRELGQVDDYGSMREAVLRRVRSESSPLPDLLLLDGGKGHVNVIRTALAEAGVSLPVFGMVKDAYHKTRTLTDGDGDIDLSNAGAVFHLVYKIQEEVHRFAGNRMMNSKRKTLKRSSLEDIPGIGARKAQLLLSHFKSIKAIREATLQQLQEAKGIGKNDAEAVRKYYGSIE